MTKMIKELIPGKLYTSHNLLVAYYNKTQKEYIIVPKGDIFTYISTEPFQNDFKTCVHFNIIFKDKFLYVEKPTLKWFLDQIIVI